MINKSQSFHFCSSFSSSQLHITISDINSCTFEIVSKCFAWEETSPLLTWRQSFLYLDILIILASSTNKSLVLSTIHSFAGTQTFNSLKPQMPQTLNLLYFKSLFSSESRREILAFSAIGMFQPYLNFPNHSDLGKVAWFQSYSGLLTFIDVRTVKFLPTAESWMVKSNFRCTSHIQRSALPLFDAWHGVFICVRSKDARGSNLLELP